MNPKLHKATLVGRLQSMYSDLNTKTQVVIGVDEFLKAVQENDIQIFSQKQLQSHKEKINKIIQKSDLEGAEKLLTKLIPYKSVQVAGTKGVETFYVLSIDMEKGEDFDHPINKRLGLEGSLIEKGKKADIGETRMWGGKESQKTATGWVPAGKEKVE